MSDIKTVTYKILKKGRKWLEGHVPGKDYLNKIEINEVSKEYVVGETYTFEAKLVWNQSKYGSSLEVYPLTSQEKEENKNIEKREKILKWLGYVKEKAYKEGYLYKNGYQTVRELGINDFPDLLEELNSAIKHIEDIKEKAKREKEERERIESQKPVHYLDVPYEEKEYAKHYGARWNGSRWYYRGDEIPSQLNKYIIGRIVDDGLFGLSGGSGYGCYGWREGQVVKATKEQIERGYPEFLYIVSTKSRYYKYDGLSFGVGDDSGYIYSARARAATDEESQELREKIAAKNKENAIKIEVTKVKKFIEENGEYPKGDFSLSGVVLFDTADIYGGGDWFVIDSEYIWYVRNNGMDGDNWSANNVMTGGAGAIGMRVKKTEELESKLINLSNGVI